MNSPIFNLKIFITRRTILPVESEPSDHSLSQWQAAVSVEGEGTAAVAAQVQHWQSEEVGVVEGASKFEMLLYFFYIKL